MTESSLTQHEHPQVHIDVDNVDVGGVEEGPEGGITCDEDIAGLIAAMWAAGVRTYSSCQDNAWCDGVIRGTVRRVYVSIVAEDVVRFLILLNRAGEATADMESLSNRMAPEYEPHPGWRAFRDDRAWWYAAHVARINDTLQVPVITIRFPYTDVGEIVRRLEHWISG